MGGLQLIAVLFSPFALFVLWVLIAAIVVVSRSPSSATTTPAPTPTG